MQPTLAPVNPVVFIDAIHVEIHDDQVANRPIYVAVGVTSPVNATSSCCGGDGGEGAKFWLAVLTEIKNRGVADVCIVVCDGPKRLPRRSCVIGGIQTCVIHLLRNTFRYASLKDWHQIAKDIGPVYTAPTEACGGSYLCCSDPCGPTRVRPRARRLHPPLLSAAASQRRRLIADRRKDFGR